MLYTMGKRKPFASFTPTASKGGWLFYCSEVVGNIPPFISWDSLDFCHRQGEYKKTIVSFKRHDCFYVRRILLSTILL